MYSKDLGEGGQYSERGKGRPAAVGKNRVSGDSEGSRGIQRGDLKLKTRLRKRCLEGKSNRRKNEHGEGRSRISRIGTSNMAWYKIRTRRGCRE